ncbi:hypothetical protein [Kitasatospora sp. NPDC056531]|uniref:hypothetical protein n=1 Tax=Kitasatospora sp. NPDC056531 TaxID=3345856 RepID=UPI0036A8CBB6
MAPTGAEAAQRLADEPPPITCPVGVVAAFHTLAQALLTGPLPADPPDTERP